MLDISKKSSFNTIFGDRIVAQRFSNIACAF